MYDREQATITIDTQVITLRGKLATMMDTVLGVRRIALATQGARLLPLYTVDGETGFTRGIHAGHWKREGIIWTNTETGEKAAQLLV